MQLLTEIYDTDELDGIVNRMKEAGIAVTVTRPEFYGVDGNCLWVCLEEQYEDAAALLKNPEHIVAHPVNIKEFENYEASPEAASVAFGSMLRALILIAIGGTLIVGIIIYLFLSNR